MPRRHKLPPKSVLTIPLSIAKSRVEHAVRKITEKREIAGRKDPAVGWKVAATNYPSVCLDRQACRRLRTMVNSSVITDPADPKVESNVRSLYISLEKGQRARYLSC
jgi:hypothetical protein